jgi:hypothetical protein
VTDATIQQDVTTALDAWLQSHTAQLGTLASVAAGSTMAATAGQAGAAGAQGADTSPPLSGTAQDTATGPGPGVASAAPQDASPTAAPDVSLNGSPAAASPSAAVSPLHDASPRGPTADAAAPAAGPTQADASSPATPGPQDASPPAPAASPAGPPSRANGPLDPAATASSGIPTVDAPASGLPAAAAGTGQAPAAAGAGLPPTSPAATPDPSAGWPDLSGTPTDAASPLPAVPNPLADAPSTPIDGAAVPSTGTPAVPLDGAASSGDLGQVAAGQASLGAAAAPLAVGTAGGLPPVPSIEALLALLQTTEQELWNALNQAGLSVAQLGLPADATSLGAAAPLSSDQLAAALQALYPNGSPPLGT